MAANSTPWKDGAYNPRGASVTLVNASGTTFVYYFCLIDFPSSATNHGFSLKPVSKIDKSTDYQLNFKYKESLPTGNDGDTTITYMLPVFTTQSGYKSSDGPITSMVVVDSEGKKPQTGNPNQHKPPIVNLALNPNLNGGVFGDPVILIAQSLTNEANYWLIPCVNMGVPGYANQYSSFSPIDTPPDGTALNATPGTNPSKTGNVVVFGASLVTYEQYSFLTINGNTDPDSQFMVGDYNNNNQYFFQL